MKQTNRFYNGRILNFKRIKEGYKPDPIKSSQCSSGVEHFHGKEGVKGSIPFIGSDAYHHKDQSIIRNQYFVN